MRATLKILFLLIFIQGYGQVDNDSIPKELKSIEYSVITDLCKDFSDWTEKKECSKQEIIQKIRRELNYKAIEKLPDNKYRIWYSFTFDKNGNLAKATVRTNHNLLKKEFQRIISKLKFDFHLIDENGKLKQGRFDFPVEILTGN